MFRTKKQRLAKSTPTKRSAGEVSSDFQFDDADEFVSALYDTTAADSLAETRMIREHEVMMAADAALAAEQFYIAN